MPRIRVAPERGCPSLRILIIEDEAKVAKALAEGLASERYEVRVAGTGEEGFFLVSSESFDLVLLDLMLPRRDGLEILAALRKRRLDTPLLVRVRALLRRGRPDQALKLQHEDLEMDLVAHTATRAARVLDLTAKEFEILEYLLRRQRTVVSREMLARDVWQVTARATPLDNVIDVTIARLRRKVDDPFARKLIHTIRGVGFVLGPEPR